jgi:hypothetical protein
MHAGRPKAVILIGAATFLYELFPDHGIEGYVALDGGKILKLMVGRLPEFEWISAFFGAKNNSKALGGFQCVYSPSNSELYAESGV